MTWQPPEPVTIALISNFQGESQCSHLSYQYCETTVKYSLKQLLAVRREALQLAFDLLEDTRENTRYDCAAALQTFIKELT